MNASLEGRRVLITGAARGLGAATARRLHAHGARVALAGLEPELLEPLSRELGGVAWSECDVSDRNQVEAAVALAVDRLGGLDVVMANAGVAAQHALIGGDPAIFERTVSVNLLGTYYTLRAAGPHIAHPRGYVLAMSSLAAAVHLPLMGPYNASKAAVEAMGNTLRTELAGSRARVGVGYFAPIDTDMTTRGFETKAAHRLSRRTGGPRPARLDTAIDAIVAGIARRSRRVVAPRWAVVPLHTRAIAQRVVEVAIRRDVPEAVDIARTEGAPLTTPQ